MVGSAALTAAALGSNTVVDGLSCSPSTPASLTVIVGPGSITQLASVDATAYGSLAADTAARSGHTEFTCLAFAPGVVVDGEALVAAVRKGAPAQTFQQDIDE